MTTEKRAPPAFVCKCLEMAARESTDDAIEPWYSMQGGHFDEFSELLTVGSAAARDVDARFDLLREHYEAHACGAPHSHVRPAKFLNVMMPVLNDACDCHHIQNTLAEPWGPRGKSLSEGSQ